MNRLHRIEEFPEGLSVGDVLPVFSEVKREIHLGQPNQNCACCRKPFNVVRKSRWSVRLYPVDVVVPVAFSYRVCGACRAMYQRGGLERDAFWIAVEAFHDGEEARQ